MQRLDKVLSRMGYGTRKEVKKAVKKGYVMVNDRTADDPGMHVDPYRDHIKIMGETVVYRDNIYIMMNKPAGVVSATEDRADQTVIDLLEGQFEPFHLFPVGRLDKDTEGLMLITSDGPLAHRLLSPRHHVPKTYFARIEGEVTKADQELFQKGIKLDDGYTTLPAELNILQSGMISEVEITLREGKYHQIKRMFYATGKKVIYLKRMSMGSLVLDPGLKPGEFRELTEQELTQLKKQE
ncbi:MAG: rRNA pseudouridine synthase [Bacillaceae bacterium]|nr:rRNA pseudouridine synthase [Bacillaceae bacterium]